MEIDLSYMPSRTVWYDMMCFNATQYMWCGPDFYSFFSLDKIQKYTDCVCNKSFAEGYRKICLWEDMQDFNAKIFRDRQWAFRNFLEFEKVENQIFRKPFKPKSPSADEDPSMEMKTGKFPHGGNLLVIYYMDKKRKNCKRSKAYSCNKSEFGENGLIYEEECKL